MRLRIAEVRHHPVAKVLCDMPAMAFDRFRCRAMVLGNNFPPFFRIKLRGYLGRAHQVAKQHRKMASLSAQTLMWLGVRLNRSASI